MFPSKDPTRRNTIAIDRSRALGAKIGGNGGRWLPFSLCRGETFLSLRGQTGPARPSGMAVDFYMCPTCGSAVKVGTACPGCVPKKNKRKKRVSAGPKKRKAWEQDSIYDGLGIPDDEFDYEEFIDREFSSKPHRQIRIKWYWWATALVLAGLMVSGVLWAIF